MQVFNDDDMLVYDIIYSRIHNLNLLYKSRKSKAIFGQILKEYNFRCVFDFICMIFMIFMTYLAHVAVAFLAFRCNT